MEGILERHAYFTDRTMGTLFVGGLKLPTIERPWVPIRDHLGGKNFKSCVPDGTYVLQAFDSDNHHNCWSLFNPELDVFVNKPDLEGRWEILIHSGNYVKDVVGCIAPGMTGDESHVWSSRVAMDKLREVFGPGDHTLVIRPRGAKN